ncbi:MAG TPA: hypothetical protein ENK28_03165, partial [Aliiroseovarius sp.]|nr:hypothetical protein [Aliiroseovarius sp.]
MPTRAKEGPMRTILFFIFFVLNFNVLAYAESIVPDRRAVIFRDTDFYGQDLQSILDTTLRACENACLARQDCNAFTFNGNKNACFLKSGAGAQTEFSGAFSAQILPTSPLALAFSGARQADLNFLHESDFAAARAQASDLPHNFV